MKNLFNTIILLTLLISCGETVKKVEDRAESATEINPESKEETVAKSRRQHHLFVQDQRGRLGLYLGRRSGIAQ